YSFFYKGTAPPDIYTLSLHDALPICAGEPHLERPDDVLAARAEQHERRRGGCRQPGPHARPAHDQPDEHRGSEVQTDHGGEVREDRKSTRLNSSHVASSYAGFCLKKK